MQKIMHVPAILNQTRQSSTSPAHQQMTISASQAVQLNQSSSRLPANKLQLTSWHKWAFDIDQRLQWQGYFGIPCTGKFSACHVESNPLSWFCAEMIERNLKWFFWPQHEDVENHILQSFFKHFRLFQLYLHNSFTFNYQCIPKVTATSNLQICQLQHLSKLGCIWPFLLELKMNRFLHDTIFTKYAKNPSRQGWGVPSSNKFEAAWDENYK